MHDLTTKYVGKSTKYNPNLVFLESEFKNYRIFAMPGGTRSGKTYSVIQFLWRNLYKYHGIQYSIVRQTLPALKATVMRDFEEIGREAKLYNGNLHNLTDKEYRYNNNLVDYFSGDDNEKIRGRKRHVLYMNEGPELPWDVVQQLLFRTSDKVILDYNPSYPESWVYDKILTRSDCAYITTTYRDNPFLTAGQLSEIEWLQLNDPEGYKVYGLGQRGELRGQIYTNWKPIKSMPVDYPIITVIDFGFSNDPTAISQFSTHNRAIYGCEKLYKKEQNNLQIACHLFFIGCDSSSMIIADSAEPKSIVELRIGWDLTSEAVKLLAFQCGYECSEETIVKLQKQLKKGFTVLAASKGQDSIDAGIQKLKQYEVFITEDSHNAWMEYRKYRWAEDKKTGKLLNVPVDESNHFMDTLRYFCLCAGRLF